MRGSTAMRRGAGSRPISRRHCIRRTISTPFANKYVFYKSDTQNKYVDQRTFAPVTEMWIVKDVVANGGIAGSGGSAHISEFYQTFSQVPEPGSLALLFAGALGLVGFAFRRRFV